MTEEDDGDFENSNKCWICVNVYVKGDIKVRSLSYHWKIIEVLQIEIVMSILN